MTRNLTIEYCSSYGVCRSRVQTGKYLKGRWWHASVCFIERFRAGWDGEDSATRESKIPGEKLAQKNPKEMTRTEETSEENGSAIASEL